LVLAVSPTPEPAIKGFWVFLRLKNRRPGGMVRLEEDRRNMARQGQDKFIKRQKELERIKKASEKMAKRQQQKKDEITKENE
jgi:hypothetical protein